MSRAEELISELIEAELPVAKLDRRQKDLFKLAKKHGTTTPKVVSRPDAQGWHVYEFPSPEKAKAFMKAIEKEVGSKLKSWHVDRDGSDVSISSMFIGSTWTK